MGTTALPHPHLSPHESTLYLMPTKRRTFLKQVALASAAARRCPRPNPTPRRAAPPAAAEIAYPRIFTGRHLAAIAFPLGGVGAGSISLGGRGQLRDWEIFNRPDKGNSPDLRLPLHLGAGRQREARRARARSAHPAALRRLQTGSARKNAPGLTRLAVRHLHRRVPAGAHRFRRLRAARQRLARSLHPRSSRTIPTNPACPSPSCAIASRNPGAAAPKSPSPGRIENPRPAATRQRQAGHARSTSTAPATGLAGLLMTQPRAARRRSAEGQLSRSPRSTADGATSPTCAAGRRAAGGTRPCSSGTISPPTANSARRPSERSAVGALCLQRTSRPAPRPTSPSCWPGIFPIARRARCGWTAPKGDENTVIGNHYCHALRRRLGGGRIRRRAICPRWKSARASFAAAMRESTLPGAVKDAAMANLSTLVTHHLLPHRRRRVPRLRRRNDHAGCCFGNCTHVWNYETATHASLSPRFARSLRKAAFGYSHDDAGRHALPPDAARRQASASAIAAADGQMGQIMQGLPRLAALRRHRLAARHLAARQEAPSSSPGCRAAGMPIATACWKACSTTPTTWSSTVPIRMCGIYYLGALRAGEEMARAVGDAAIGRRVPRASSSSGSQWIDANLFNGEYYIQKVRGDSQGQDRAGAASATWAPTTPRHPNIQVGDGCLVDQLIGQYLADVAGLGPLLAPANIRKTLRLHLPVQLQAHAGRARSACSAPTC